MDWIPNGNRLIITKIETPPVTSAGGAILTESDINTGERGKIVTCTESRHSIAKIGMEIIYPKNTAKEIYLDGTRYFTLFEHEVWFFKPSKEVAEDKSF